MKPPLGRTELSQTHTEVCEVILFKFTVTQLYSHFLFFCRAQKSKVLTCPLLSTSSFRVFVLQGSRGHQFST